MTEQNRITVGVDGSTTRARRAALVVYESMFGNTATIAAAVASGLRDQGVETTLTEVNEAPAPVGLAVDLVVLGAPTHAFSLSRPSTRADAVRQGADPRHAGTGVREWLTGSPSDRIQPVLAIFDTRVAKVRRLPLGAGRAAARLARQHGWRVLDTTAFTVSGTPGPVVDGEATRAASWGRDLGALITRSSDASA